MYVNVKHSMRHLQITYSLNYNFGNSEVVVAVPACYLDYVRQRLPEAIGVAAQNCYKAPKGAFTGTPFLCIIIFKSQATLYIAAVSNI